MLPLLSENIKTTGTCGRELMTGDGGGGPILIADRCGIGTTHGVKFPCLVTSFRLGYWRGPDPSKQYGPRHRTRSGAVPLAVGLCCHSS